MKWIIGAGKDIIQNTEQLSARSRYIGKVTGVDVTPWRNLSIKNSNLKFLICTSLDERNGSFITAHIYDIILLRNCREIICIFLESMLIYVMNEFSDSGGHFHGT